MNLIDKHLGEARLLVCSRCPQRSLVSGVWFEGTPYEIRVTDAPVCGKPFQPVKGKSCGCFLHLKAPITLFDCPQKPSLWKNVKPTQQ